MERIEGENMIFKSIEELKCLDRTTKTVLKSALADAINDSHNSIERARRAEQEETDPQKHALWQMLEKRAENKKREYTELEQVVLKKPFC